MEFPWGNVLTAAATIGGVIIANLLTQTSSRSTKLMDMRREAYGKMCSALARASYGLLRQKRLYSDREGEIRRSGAAEYFREASAAHVQAGDALQEFSELMDTNQIVCSLAFVQIIQEALPRLEAQRANGWKAWTTTGDDHSVESQIERLIALGGTTAEMHQAVHELYLRLLTQARTEMTRYYRIRS